MNDSKNKFIGILRLLYENTDADHTMDTYQIMNSLEAMNCGRPDRKTIDSTIRYLIDDLGFGIEKEKGKPNRYKWSHRTLDEEELKMIIDALRTSSFISRKNRLRIVTKLKDFTSMYIAGTLDRDVVVSSYLEMPRRSNQAILDSAFEATETNKKVSITTFEYDIAGNEVIKDESLRVNPYLIIWNFDSSYILGTLDNESKIIAFKIRNIYSIEILDEERALPPAGFVADNYSRHLFDLLEGELTEVTLECDNDIVDAVFDRFGFDIVNELVDNSTFRTKVATDVNAAFYAWVFRFNGKMKIIGPGAVRDGYIEMLQNQLNNK